MDDLGCGKCGYNVYGLPTPICPECGSNLDEVGRVSLHKTLGKRIRRAILLTFVLAIASGGVLIGIFFTLIPVQVSRKATVWLFGPASNAYVDIRLDFSSFSWRLPNWSVDVGGWQSCRLKLQRLDGSSDIVVADLGNGTFRATRSDGWAAGRKHPPSAEMLSEWLSDNSLDSTPDQDVLWEEGETLTQVLDDAVNRGPLFRLSQDPRVASVRNNITWSWNASGPTVVDHIPGSSFLSASFWRRGSVRWLDTSEEILIGLWAGFVILSFCHLVRRKKPA